ncbi:MAG: FAD-dependent oxidoreductase [Gemmatimonadetes bacterium]|nr:FAD-dependent oxidoreductase [Gemmatimonadota bacterium]
MSYAGEQYDRDWRALIFPSDYRNPVPTGRYDLVVVGAGPAGLITAIAAAGLGARVALAERHAMGGDCLNVGCVPSKALLSAASRGLSFDQAFAWLREVRAGISRHDSVERYSQAGVDVYLGHCAFVDAHTLEIDDQRLRTRKAVIATGAVAALPPVPGLQESGPHTNETIFDLRRQPGRLGILGAGPIGCELAQAFARLGSEVHLLDLQPRVLPAEDTDAGSIVARALQRDGVKLHLGAGTARVESDGASRRVFTEKGEQIVVDEILVAAGRLRSFDGLGLERAGVRFDARNGIEVNERLRSSHPDIYAAGDACNRHQFTHHADAQARIVVQNALFMGRVRTDRLIVPWCTFTSPEVAHVGLTRREADETQVPFDAWRVDWAELDRARTDAAAEGFAEVLTARGTDRIIGATLVGKDAGEQIAALLLLMNNGLGLDAIGRSVIPYPTRSEYLRHLADARSRRRLTPFAAKLLKMWLRLSR